MVKRKSIRKKTTNFNLGVIKEFFISKKNSFKSYRKIKYKKIKDYLNKKYCDEITAIKKFIIKIVGYGFIISIPIYTFSAAFFNIFSESYIFNIFSYPFFLLSFGIIWYFIEDEFITIFRRLIAKR